MKRLSFLFSILTGLCLTVVFAVTFAQVIQRYVFQMAMPWATDIIRIFFVYSVFFGMAVGVFQKKHLNIDVIVHALPKKLKPWLDLLSNGVTGIFLAFVFYFSFSFMMDNTDQVTPYLLFPMSYVYLIVPVTVGFMLIFLLWDSFQLLNDLRSGKGLSSRGNKP